MLSLPNIATLPPYWHCVVYMERFEVWEHLSLYRFLKSRLVSFFMPGHC